MSSSSDPNLTLEDFVYSYPSIDDPDFQTKFTAKKEINELATAAHEPLPQRGSYFKHQILIQRYFLQYDRCLLIHRPGQGKTCSGVLVSETFKKSVAGAVANIIMDRFQQTIVEQTPSRLLDSYFKNEKTQITKTFVLVPRPNLREEFKTQIICACTASSRYQSLIETATRDSKTEKDRKKAITKALTPYYDVKVYTRLAENIIRSNDQELKDQYSGSLFIIDEAHNLHSSDEPDFGGTTDTETATTQPTEKLAIKSTKKQRINKKDVWNAFFRLFHVVDRCKVILLTATPMVNSVNEIVSLMNLILPLDQQMPEGSTEKSPNNIDYSRVTLDDVKGYFNGRVSFVREMDTSAIPVYQSNPEAAEDPLLNGFLDRTYTIGDRTYPSFQIIYKTLMSLHQQEGYKKAIGWKDPETQKRSGYNYSEFEASDFVFPDGSFGRYGFQKYVKLDKNGYHFNLETQPSIRPYLNDVKLLSELSCKYAKIIELALQERANTFVFNSIVAGSGHIVLGLCLEAFGFNQFIESSSIFGGGPREAGLQPICNTPSEVTDTNGPVDSVRAAGRIARIPPRRRYALYTGTTYPGAVGDNRYTILQTFNSWENRDGKYIEVLLGSPVAGEGINTANVTRVHLINGNWNQATTFQILSRVLRVNSHERMLKELQAEYLKRGLNPDDAYIEVKIYQHAALMSDGRSIDLEMYAKSERKDIEIKRLERLMKQCAIDCWIHKERNVRLGINIKRRDKDYTPACDYDICDYQCVNPRPLVQDETSYNILYSKSAIDQIKDDIKLLFRLESFYTLEQLYQRLPSPLYRKQDVNKAITQLVTERKQVFNKYGYPSYILNESNNFYLALQYPIGAESNERNLLDSYYNQNLVMIDEQPLNVFVTKIKKFDINRVFESSDPMPLFNTINVDTKIDIIEKAWIRYLQVQETVGSKIIREQFQKYIYSADKPVNRIAEIQKGLENQKTGRGRKPQDPGKIKIKKLTFKDLPIQEEGGGELVYFHNLDVYLDTNVVSGRNARILKGEGNIRLLTTDQSTSTSTTTKPLVWRNATDPEKVAYNELIQLRIREESDRFKDELLYGKVDRNKGRDNFSIVSYVGMTPEQIASLSNKKTRIGMAATSFRVPQLYELLHYLNLVPNINVKDTTKAQMVRTISITTKTPDTEVSAWSDDKIESVYKWIVSGYNRNQLITEIRNELEQRNLILEL